MPDILTFSFDLVDPSALMLAVLAILHCLAGGGGC
jgi:hypothetical protein